VADIGPQMQQAWNLAASSGGAGADQYNASQAGFLTAAGTPATQVTPQTPPTFIFQTNEDTTVPAENAVYYYLALRKASVPAEMHIFEKGAHGLGLANDNPALSAWSSLLASWLRGRGVIK